VAGAFMELDDAEVLEALKKHRRARTAYPTELFLKSLRFGSASDMKRSRKKGDVLLERLGGEGRG